MDKNVHNQQRHEDLYRKTIDGTLKSVRAGCFTEASVPRILMGLRMELGQCVEMLMVSSEFYAEQMARLQGEVAEVMES